MWGRRALGFGPHRLAQRQLLGHLLRPKAQNPQWVGGSISVPNGVWGLQGVPGVPQLLQPLPHI